MSCHIKPQFIRKAYKLGARWNHDKLAWDVDPSIPEFKEYTQGAKRPSIFDMDHPEFRLDDRINSVVDDTHPIQNIFTCDLNASKCLLLKLQTRNYIYYRADCKCELCKNPKILKGYRLVVYESRCKLYRNVCPDCYSLVTINLNSALDEELIARYLSLSGMTREEFYKMLVNQENGIIQ